MKIKRNIYASSALCEKISSNNDLQLVVWKIKDFQSHVLMIAVTVGLSQ